MNKLTPRSVRVGLTLIEVLIASFLFGLFMTIACFALVRCYANYTSERDIQVAFRQGSVAFERMSKELSQCHQVYSPDPGGVWAEGATATPTVGAPLLFAYQEPDISATPAVGIGLSSAPWKGIGYQLDVPNKSLQRLVFAQGADPSTSAPLSIRVVASPVVNFTILHVLRKDADNSLCVQANAGIPVKNLVNPIPIFFQTNVLEMKNGI